MSGGKQLQMEWVIVNSIMTALQINSIYRAHFSTKEMAVRVANILRTYKYHCIVEDAGDNLYSLTVSRPSPI